MSPARQEVERRLAAEWMAERYEGQRYWLNFPLGPVPPGAPSPAMGRSWRRKVDGLAIVDRAVHLVEFKIWKPWDGIDKLPVYKAGVPYTPELGPARNYPVRMLLVTPRPTPALLEAARLLGIQVEVVKGGWIDDVVKRIEWLWTREGREAMEERRRLRAWLGLG